MGFFFNLHPFHRKKINEETQELVNQSGFHNFITHILPSCFTVWNCVSGNDADFNTQMSMQINEHKEYLSARGLEPFPWIFQLKTFLLRLRLSTWYSLARRHRKKPLLLVSLIQLSRTSFSTGKMSVTLITFSSFKPSLEDLVKKATDWLLVKQHAKQQHCLAWKK